MHTIDWTFTTTTEEVDITRILNEAGDASIVVVRHRDVTLTFASTLVESIAKRYKAIQTVFYPVFKGACLRFDELLPETKISFFSGNGNEMRWTYAGAGTEPAEILVAMLQAVKRVKNSQVNTYVQAITV